MYFACCYWGLSVFARRRNQPQATEKVPLSSLESKPELPANDFRPELDVAGEIIQRDGTSEAIPRVMQGEARNPGKPAELPALPISRGESN